MEITKFVLYSYSEFRWRSICIKHYETIEKNKVRSVPGFILFHHLFLDPCVQVWNTEERVTVFVTVFSDLTQESSE